MEIAAPSFQLEGMEKLHIVQYAGEEWAAAPEVAIQLLGWSPNSLRKELFVRGLRKVNITDKNIIRYLAQEGAVGDGIGGLVGHVRSVNLIPLSLLPTIVETLQPRKMEDRVQEIRDVLVS